MKTKIYENAKNLGLSMKEVDSFMSNTCINEKTVGSVDLYRADVDCFTVSMEDAYKAGTFYGTVSIKDF